ncbi:Protein of unknown function [Cotesia congregata]|uniref:Uncharacterized protein n=1 Tax=Cotesia congregata TaxID=51543 RepID=A0A8J2EB53_COTCN|nr:Protein of unknown function [Cotesia congregata]
MVAQILFKISSCWNAYKNFNILLIGHFSESLIRNELTYSTPKLFVLLHDRLLYNIPSIANCNSLNLSLE